MSDSQAAPRCARLQVNLAAVAHNYRYLARLAADAGCAACVKADAYGLGLEPIVRTLAGAGCEEFFVATPGEGQRVRALLPRGAIYVLNGYLPGQATSYLDHALTPVLNDLDEVTDWCRDAPRQPAALQLDTGMARLGLDLSRIADLRARHPAFRPVLVLGHLACADLPGDARNTDQRQRFSAALTALGTPRASLAGSSAMHLGAGYHYQLVRPGAALYGINPVAAQSNPVRAVVRLQAPVLQLRRVETPTGVGYGGNFQAPAGTLLATLGIGYADGYPRAAGNRAQARIAGIAVPVVGRVSMDLLTVDLSGLATEAVPVRGALVDLLDEHYGVDALAGTAGTIGYEILTRLGAGCMRLHTGPAP